MQKSFIRDIKCKNEIDFQIKSKQTDEEKKRSRKKPAGNLMQFPQAHTHLLRHNQNEDARN